MKLAIVGSRTFEDVEHKDLFVHIIKQFSFTHIVTGDCPTGADRLAICWAKAFNIPYSSHKAEWNKYGISAGYKRNCKIWEEADCGVAFWDGKSPGTKQSLSISKRLNKELLIVRFD